MHHITRSQEEHDEIEQRCGNRKFTVHACLQEIKQQHNGINDTQPFDLDRYDKHKQHLHIRKRRRKCEENRHIDIICAEIQGTDQKIILRSHCRDAIPVKQIMKSHQQKAACYSKKHPLEQIYIIPVCAPCSLQRRPDRTIKVEHDQCQKDIAATGWNQDPCEQSPDLSM